jgi:uncharacterized membrane protein
MMEWYCGVGGKQYGPVSGEILMNWIAQGRVGPSDMVWAAGMPQWVEARTVPGLFGVGVVPAGATWPPISPWSSTGGQTRNAELMAQARALLAGHWELAVGFVLLFWLLMFAALGVPVVGPVALLILGGPLQLGLVIFFLTLARRGKADIGMLFAGFKNFGNALGAYLLMFVLVLGWVVLPALAGAAIAIGVGFAYGAEYGVATGLILGGIPSIVSGVLAALRYSQTFYLLADDPRLDSLEAIQESKAMMHERKWKLFCLGFRFIGWALLSFLTCGVGFLWLTPYMSVSMARFYDDLRGAPQNA